MRVLPFWLIQHNARDRSDYGVDRAFVCLLLADYVRRAR